ncbi:MAG: hypothetical protein ABSA16_04430 [Thermoguttaceae bacterium]|jgi:hypothetical protein
MQKDELPSLETPYEKGGWQRLDNGNLLVFSDQNCELLFPKPVACMSMHIEPAKPPLPEKHRIFTIAKIGKKWFLKIRVNGGEDMIIPDLSPDFDSDIEAHEALCLWYHKQRAHEIRDDAKCKLEKHGFKLKDPELVPIKKQ